MKTKQYHEVEHLRPLEVEVGPSEDDFQFAMRTFRSKVQKEKILTESKKKARFEKPSVKKRRKQRESKNRDFLFQRAQQRLTQVGQIENK